MLNHPNIVKIWARCLLILQSILIPFGIKYNNIFILFYLEGSNGDSSYLYLLVLFPHFFICKRSFQDISNNIILSWMSRDLLWEKKSVGQNHSILCHLQCYTNVKHMTQKSMYVRHTLESMDFIVLTKSRACCNWANLGIKGKYTRNES